MTAVMGDIPQALVATTGPGSQVPVAFLGRTSSERLQDPVASLRRQVRNARAWLPPGCQIVAWYWDVESGGLDLDARGHGDTGADRRHRRPRPRRRPRRPFGRGQVTEPGVRVRGV